MKSKIIERISELEKERDDFVLQANAQVASFNGGIAELKRLISEPPAAANALHPEDGGVLPLADTSQEAKSE